jgi:hypothetical protein
MSRYRVTLHTAGTVDQQLEKSLDTARALARNHAAFWAEPATIEDTDTGSRYSFAPITAEETVEKSPYDLKQEALF